MVYPETGSPTNMMLKKSSGGVLASLRSSTYRGVRLRLFARCGLAWGKARLGRARVWAGEKSGLFEHPVWCAPVLLDVRTIEFPPCHNSFSAAC